MPEMISHTNPPAWNVVIIVAAVANDIFVGL